jgi:hypothetical protein
MGFLPSGSYGVHRAIRSFERLFPLAVYEPSFSAAPTGLESVGFLAAPHSPAGLYDTASHQARPTSGLRSLRAALSPIRTIRSKWERATLLGFILPRGLFSCRRVFLGTRPLMGFSLLAPATSTLQSLPRKKLGTTLSSQPPLSRFATFSVIQVLSEFGFSGLPLGDRTVLPPS